MPRLDRRRLLTSGLAAAALPILRSPAAAAGRTLNVYGWDTYLGPTTLADFTAATGIAVRYDVYASNAELFARLREGNPGYDVIFPSSDNVERMIAAGMLMRLDQASIPGMANIASDFADPAYDPGRAHSAPYFWGAMGIGYRRPVAPPESWSVLFEPRRHRGRIALLDNSDIVRVAMKYLGHSINDTEPAKIAQAVELLIAAKPHVKSFAPDTGQDLLAAGEVDLCAEWSGDLLQVMEEDADLGFAIPAEGTLLWEDALCIPAGAPNPAAAHAFIEFILQPEVHAAIARAIRYPCPNAAALPLIPEADRLNPTIYPPTALLARSERRGYGGEAAAARYEAALTRVLAA
ncbi:ABC transporter substrate-binding protein [Marinimicrococcus flavescens]|uniref:Putrescine-binding periplasmic protein n=1 Tax=Marinimicrococcus flavescens TaxID=3031815 RepID=A0AAP3XQ55_9PROT|nr:spermidine/putrescine ABC transporter substrate-binding protein [Marinimicrococcus flavescens]